MLRICILVLSLAMTGCAAYQVEVNGFRAIAHATNNSYWILSGNEGVPNTDLEFQEYASYLKRGLAEAGFTEAKDYESAGVGIFLSYCIGSPEEHTQSYSVPVYGQTGGGTYTYQGTVNAGYRSATTYGTVYQQPQYGVIGSKEVVESTVTLLRQLSVQAVDLKIYRSEKAAVPVWQTDVHSRGNSTDLRRVFPVMVACAAPYFGRNTHNRLRIEISENDSRVQRIRGNP